MEVEVTEVKNPTAVAMAVLATEVQWVAMTADMDLLPEVMTVA